MSSAYKNTVSVFFLSLFLLLSAGCSTSSSSSDENSGSEDTTPPVITLLGDNPIYLDIDAAFSDPGATAVDVVDGNLTAGIVVTGVVDTSVAGSYTVTYTVTDLSANSAEVTRTVVVVGPAEPVITLLGDNPLYVGVGDTYDEPGATAVDAMDGNITASIEINTTGLDTSVIGSYIVTYSVTDSDDNNATATRDVIVLEPTVIYEDAEDGNITGWSIYDNDPVGGTITNVDDAGLGSRVIQLDGNETRIGFEFRNEPNPGVFVDWNNATHKILEMDMKYVGTEQFKIIVKCDTDDGLVWVTYANYPQPASDTSVWIDISGGVTGDTWEHFSTSSLGDIATAINDANSSNHLQEIDGLRIKASMSLDNILLRI